MLRFASSSLSPSCLACSTSELSAKGRKMLSAMVPFDQATETCSGVTRPWMTTTFGGEEKRARSCSSRAPACVASRGRKSLASRAGRKAERTTAAAGLSGEARRVKKLLARVDTARCAAGSLRKC